MGHKPKIGQQIAAPGLAYIPSILDDPQISRLFCDLVEQEMIGRQPWPQVLADVVRRTALEIAPVCQVRSPALLP